MIIVGFELMAYVTYSSETFGRNEKQAKSIELDVKAGAMLRQVYQLWSGYEEHGSKLEAVSRIMILL